MAHKVFVSAVYAMPYMRIHRTAQLAYGPITIIVYNKDRRKVRVDFHVLKLLLLLLLDPLHIRNYFKCNPHRCQWRLRVRRSVAFIRFPWKPKDYLHGGRQFVLLNHWSPRLLCTYLTNFDWPLSHFLVFQQLDPLLCINPWLNCRLLWAIIIAASSHRKFFEPVATAPVRINLVVNLGYVGLKAGLDRPDETKTTRWSVGSLWTIVSRL